MTDVSRNVAFLFERAMRRRNGGDAWGAATLLEEVLALVPEHWEALRELAILRLIGAPHNAAGLAYRLVQLRPDEPLGWNLLGQAVSSLGRANEAVANFTRAAQLDPGDPRAHANLAVALTRAGDPLGAVDAAHRAIDLNSDLPEGYASLGHALNVLQRSEEAVSAFQSALRLRPGSPDILMGLSMAMRDLGLPSTALVAIKRATELAPQSLDYRLALGAAYLDMSDVEAAKHVWREAEGLSLTQFFASSVLLSEQYDPQLDERASAMKARKWGARAVATTPPASIKPRVSASRKRKLRIGYVSADFYRHPVGWLASGPICSHDRDAFHVTLYANQTCADELTEQMQRSVDDWRPILGLEDDAAAARIVADEIDVLVDLSGHTAGNRLAVFARRCAPVQVSWLGYFATTGLPTMDYVLLDDEVLDDEDQIFVEKTVHMSSSRFCYTPPPYAKEPVRPAAGEKSRVTFGSFNRNTKINRDVIALWAQVLAEVPDSDLLLKWRSYSDPLLQASTRAEFEKHGIDPERIRFDGHTSHADMMAQYSDVDVALDPFPFSGGLTSIEALWMGVPVVTLPGKRMVSRQTHSILRVLGQSEFSAQSPEHYVQIATRLAEDVRFRSRLRLELRQTMSASRLCDAGSFARELEEIYTKLAAKAS